MRHLPADVAGKGVALPWLALLASLILGAVHVLGGHAHRLRGVPRSWLLSAGSGVSVAYVFLHLLPEVAGLGERLGSETAGWWVALGGLAVVYGLELLARRSSGAGDELNTSEVSGLVHLISYTIYNAIVGFLLVERARLSATELWLFVVAMALHFLVNDHGLRERHGDEYRRYGRWVVAVGVVAGTVLGVAYEPTALGLELVVGFLAGGVVMNVLKEELPADRESRWTPFMLAAVVYGALLAAI